ncbi:putative glycerophosphodiester phosphodiesterase, protein kinase RLK-Pelle-LRK10L-2 family [Lupinus albus]|uniref:Putative glycerophosphodiester phosphodiesterase, protein kinase RLK-Pelle-LRK10L-2 family n=1 Tax=Lupinus albus TaxID=3870 RepID=A0A6A4PTX6_LUPAL|nr:putative glycerophosphodiester phosphodiesterase, protein kinase RLK-Pelle-LRK10L-2 family [Lupinus albus]
MEMAKEASFYSIYAITITILLLFQQTCTSIDPKLCPPSSCGKTHNITYPFRLKTDPITCGDTRYELDCHNNNTLLTLFSGKYYVQDIDYNKYTILVSDVGVIDDEDSNCSFIPSYFLYEGSFGNNFIGPGTNPFKLDATITISYFNCSNMVIDDHRYVDVGTTCSDSGGHIYAVVDNSSNHDFSVMDIKIGCQLKVSTFANWGRVEYDKNKNISYDEIHNMLVYGFRLSWLYVICEDQCGKGFDCHVVDESTGEVQCDHDQLCPFLYDGPNKVIYDCGGSGIWSNILDFIISYAVGFYAGLKHVKRGDEYDGIGANIGEAMGRYIPPYIIVRYLLGLVAFILLLIYKWRRRHKSMYENIEDFLQRDTFMPIRYSYKEIKKMTYGFREKLGQGGFGLVYKGKLRSGSFVAIKMLTKSKDNGQDFISEVGTIGRIHHANVVRLIGFCVEGSTKALVYEFMPNGSLDKYIFSKQDNVLLSYEKIYEISLGVAHAISYLHNDCDMQILHFDIKPHNILLDENFVPKLSDFGLAKLYPVDKNVVTMTGARGTLGYMAPELFYHNLGGVSYKADVYSFGMLLMEMASRRRNFISNVESDVQSSSQLYFPMWIYDQLDKDKDIELENLTKEENEITKKMIIVALWCIQLKPSDRPSMYKVVEMLEEESESIEMPPKPSLYPRQMVEEENISHQTQSDDYTCSTSYSE